MAAYQDRKIFTEDTCFLGRNIQYLIKNHRLNIRKISQILDMPVMTVRRLISGETVDPRISTLKMLADYFEVSIDSLMHHDIEHKKTVLQNVNDDKPKFLPILDWETAKEANDLQRIDLKSWTNWHPVASYKSLNQAENKCFILESRASMYPRFHKGTLLVINTGIEYVDGDIVLLKINSTNELTLREIIADPPGKLLKSIISDTGSIRYHKNEHEIIGVVVLTMLYARNID